MEVAIPHNLLLLKWVLTYAVVICSTTWGAHCVLLLLELEMAVRGGVCGMQSIVYC